MEKQESLDEFYCPSYEKPTYKELYEKYYKIIKVLSGTSILTGNNRKITVKAGEFVFVNRGGFSRIQMYPEKNRPFRLLCLNFTDKFLEQYSHHNIQPAISGTRPKAFEPIRTCIPLEALFSSLYIYAQHNIHPDKTIMELKLTECAHILSLCAPQLFNEMLNKHPGQRLNLEVFMNANYMYNAPLERFAELSGRSLSTFRREFEVSFGMSPNKWLIHKRLEAAYQKISVEGARPSDIFWELGFETLSHFSRKFKEKYGVSPSQLKKS